MSTSLQKSNLGWPQQPLTERVPNISENLIFGDPFHKTGPILVILVPRIVRPSGSGNRAVEVGENSEVAEAAAFNEAAEVSKAYKITT